MASWECQVCEQTVCHGGIGFSFKIWHNRCFRCADCDLLLNSYNYRARDGKPYCLAHYRSETSAADDRGSFVMLPLAGMKEVLYDCQAGVQQVMANLVFPVLPGSMIPPKSKASAGAGIIKLPQLFPQSDQTKQQSSSSEPTTSRPKTVSGNSQKDKVATTIKEHTNKNRVIVSISAAGDKTMQLAIGSICVEKVDVIVNSIGTGLDLAKGALSKAIKEAAGAEIQTELRLLGRKPPAEPGSIIATKGYKLPCKHVLHVILKSWAASEHSVQNLRQLVSQILSKADELEARSIAFPLLGIGVLGYPRNAVAQVLYMEVMNYLDSNISSCLQQVVFSVPEVETEVVQSIRAWLLGEKTPDKAAGLQDDDQVKQYVKLLSEHKTTRRKSQPLKLPSCGKIIEGSRQPYARVELNTTDAEYVDVVRLMSSRNGKNFTKLVYKIERIENYFLWAVYSAMKDALDRTNPKGMQNERTLWHGTQLQALENIIASGFNRCFNGRAVYGKGVYFAHNFSYSAQDNYSLPDFTGCKYIFQCRVLTGVFCKGSSELVEPPIDPETNLHYNSTVDSLESPTVFVTFRDYAMYPEYLITLLRT